MPRHAFLFATLVFLAHAKDDMTIDDDSDNSFTTVSASPVGPHPGSFEAIESSWHFPWNHRPRSLWKGGSLITNPGNKNEPPLSVVQFIPANGGEESTIGFGPALSGGPNRIALSANFILETPSVITGLEFLAYQILLTPFPTESTILGLFVRIYKDDDGDGLDADDTIVFGNANLSNPILSANILTNTFRTGGFRVLPSSPRVETRPILAAQARDLHIDLTAGNYFVEFQFTADDRYPGPFVPPVYPSIAKSSVSGLPGPTCCEAGFGLRRQVTQPAAWIPEIQSTFGVDPAYEYQVTFPFAIQGFTLAKDFCLAIDKPCRPGGFECCNDESGAQGLCIDNVCISP